MKTIPPVYIQKPRFSETKRPPKGSRCVFSPFTNFTRDEIAPKAFHSSLYPHIYSGARCVVLSTSPHTVTVRFEDAPKAHGPDITCPDYLFPEKLTEFGEAFLSINPEAKTKMKVLGEHLR